MRGDYWRPNNRLSQISTQGGEYLRNQLSSLNIVEVMTRVITKITDFLGGPKMLETAVKMDSTYVGSHFEFVSGCYIAQFLKMKLEDS